jgi:hypothetical protein
MDNLDQLLQNAEALPAEIKSTADACGDDLELKLRLSLHWVAARKLAQAMRGLVRSEPPIGPPILRLVK